MSSPPGAATWTPRAVRVGEWRITALTDGTMHLDGGSMWGVVPRTLWERMTPPASDHTIRLALRPFLAERGDDRVVVEVGLGDRWEDKWREIYRIEREVTLAASLAAVGVAPEDVTHVVASHCHFDHIGAMVVRGPDGLAPFFPNARHFAPRIEVEMARNPDHVRRASYRPDDVVPVLEAGLLETYEGSAELLDGLRVHDAGGHSDGTSLVTFGEGEVGQGGETAVFWADVVPTTHHIQPAYIMAYDIDVVRSFENRSRWLERACEEGWLGLFYHDPDHAFGRIVRDGKRYAFEPVEGELRT